MTHVHHLRTWKCFPEAPQTDSLILLRRACGGPEGRRDFSLWTSSGGHTEHLRVSAGMWFQLLLPQVTLCPKTSTAFNQSPLFHRSSSLQFLEPFFQALYSTHSVFFLVTFDCYLFTGLSNPLIPGEVPGTNRCWYRFLSRISLLFVSFGQIYRALSSLTRDRTCIPCTGSSAS